MSKVLSHARLLELLSYDAVTGAFHWRKHQGGMKAGDRAGCARDDGYRTLTIDGERHLEHRLAWFYVHGKWPSALLDHRNRQRSANVVSNLRPTDHRGNCENRSIRADNSSGFIGVSWHKPRQKWQARIASGGRRQHLGLFETPELAHEAYLAAKAQRHAFHPGACA